MKCNTNGEIIPEMLDICNCESTYGCDKCRPPVKTNKFGKMLASWKNLDFTIKIKQRKIKGSKMEKYLLSKKNLKALVENVRDTPEWSDDRHINLLTNYTNPASKIMEGEVLESSMGTPFLKIDYDKFQEALKNYIGKDVEIYIQPKVVNNNENKDGII